MKACEQISNPELVKKSKQLPFRFSFSPIAFELSSEPLSYSSLFNNLLIRSFIVKLLLAWLRLIFLSLSCFGSIPVLPSFLLIFLDLRFNKLFHDLRRKGKKRKLSFSRFNEILEFREFRL